jgi:hypothetical protein
MSATVSQIRPELACERGFKTLAPSLELNVAGSDSVAV